MSELRFLTAGESHGPCLTAILEGLPAGLALDIKAINRDLARRQQGYGRGGRMKIEKDKAEILSGVRFGETLGGPITLRVVNRDFANWTDRMAAFGAPTGEPVTAARPGHADLTGCKKYARSDIRDILERLGARETTMRVAVGALCKEFLRSLGIDVVSHVTKIGGVAVNPDHIDVMSIGRTESGAQLLRRGGGGADEGAHPRGDGGGRYARRHVRGHRCAACRSGSARISSGDRRLDARLAGRDDVHPGHQGRGDRCRLPLLISRAARCTMRCTSRARMSIAGRTMRARTRGRHDERRAGRRPRGHEAHSDADAAAALRRYRVEEARARLQERSDACASTPASVVGEAMTAFVIAQAIVEKFGGDAMVDDARLSAYNERVEKDW